jgi:Recombinase
MGVHGKPGDNARKVRTARADAHAAKVAPTIKKLQASGVTTLRAIAAKLNARGIPTPRGQGQWQAAQVWRVLARL